MSKKEKPIVHFIAQKLLHPLHPVVVNLVGVGGTGSHMLTALSRINHCLVALGHPGLQAQVFDEDIVTESNAGRCLFTQSDIGINKAVVLVNRNNRFFGTNWKAVPQRYTADNCRNYRSASLTISCVDNVATRLEIAAILNRTNTAAHQYWMDFGNNRFCGQAILSTVKKIEQPKSRKFRTVDSLPLITEEFGEMLNQAEAEDNTPSCSLAEALEQQDLFINSNLANLGGSLLWTMFRDGILTTRGFFINVQKYKTEALKVA